MPKRPDKPGVPDLIPDRPTMKSVREAASDCQACDLYKRGTQTVFGEGAKKAALMFVGEQPGDQEDLAGRPFIGPAGTVFDEAIAQAGIDRSRLYVTNAVKHFKYEPRGKRRIHQKPNLGEVQHCRWWLKLELDLIRPRLVVAMGATAFYALTGEKQKLADVRGRAIAMQEGRSLFVTVHPSYLLRIPDEERKAQELARFRQEMSLIKGLAA
jgi:DNA polymerase